jgi:exodeoxyribonuclease V alpha subunit
MQRLKGYVEQIIYSNNENGYTVLTLVCGDEEIKCTGIMNGISQGETVEVEGEKTVHKEYGDQFSVRSWHPVAPDTETEMARYLGSGAIKGVGEALAARIIEKFGPDTFRVIDEEPERLAEVRGISSRMAQSIGAQIFEKKDTRSAMLFLRKYGISNEMSVRIYKKYGQEIYTIIRENPYRLADDISGIGFRTADEIAMKIGIRRDDSFRIRSGFIYVLNEAGAEGNCYLPREILFQRMERLVGQAGSQMEDELENLAMEQKVIIKKRGSECRIYGPLYYYAELNCARMLKELDIHVADDNAETNAHIDSTIELLEKTAYCQARYASEKGRKGQCAQRRVYPDRRTGYRQDNDHTHAHKLFYLRRTGHNACRAYGKGRQEDDGGNWL